MEKSDVLARINKGPMNYKDFGRIKFYTEPSRSFPGEYFLHGMVMSDSRYSIDAGFGGCFLSDVTDDDCEKLDGLFASIREKMQKADSLGASDPVELLKFQQGITGGTFYRANNKTLALEDYIREETGTDWFYLYVQYQGENDYAYGLPVILDGALYRPIYSFWLGHSYYDRNHPNGLDR